MIKNLVSIITPAYNMGHFLSETLASVQAQSYTEWEWIIVNDGSTDNTTEVVTKAAENDSRIHLLQLPPPNGLSSRARNMAMQHARGEYFAMLDADDLWKPEKLARQVFYLQDHPEADGVCCWWHLIGDPDHLKKSSIIMKTSPVCRRSDFLHSVSFQTSTILFRRSCYELLGDMDESPELAATEDFDYFANLVSQCSIHRLREYLSYYRLHQCSYTHQVLESRNIRGWRLFETMQKKGFYTPREAARKKSFLYYEQAMNNLFFFHAPFRRYLIKSFYYGHPPVKAIVMFALCFLPAQLLRPTLFGLQRIIRRLKYTLALLQDKCRAMLGKNRSLDGHLTSK